MGGIEVSIGKLAIYTAAGGIDPTRVIPVMLDVGTNRESLLGDPMYIGNRHARIRGERYDAFIEAYVKAATKLFPHALLQWEDFAPGNGRRILEKYRGRIRTFNDDMQGTGAITLAAAISAVRVCGRRCATSAWLFSARARRASASPIKFATRWCAKVFKREAAGRFWCVDRQGLLTTEMGGRSATFSAYARPAAESKGWKHERRTATASASPRSCAGCSRPC